MAVKVGTRFRSTYADGNCLFEVTERAGPDAWRAVVVDEPIEFNGQVYPSDFAGVEQLFSTKQVEQALKWEQHLQRSREERDDFYDSLMPGDILHYHNGFGNYVRCEVVLADGNAEASEQGEWLLLQPIALVGNWKPMDLPKRYIDGSVDLGYHAKKVTERSGAWAPHTSCIYEAPNFVAPRTRQGGIADTDPRNLDPIDLSLPEPSAEERVRYGKARLLMLISDIASDLTNPDVALAKIRQLVND